MTIHIDERQLGPYSLNAYYSGMHHHQRSKYARYWHDLTQIAARQAGIRRKPQDGPWRVTFYFNSRLDIDNHGVIAKMIIDALKGWVWPNDTKRYLRAVSMEFWENPGVLVEISKYCRETGRKDTT